MDWRDTAVSNLGTDEVEKESDQLGVGGVVEESGVTDHQVLLGQHQLGAGHDANLLLHLGEAEDLQVQLQVGGGSDEGGQTQTEEDGVDAGVGSLLSLENTDIFISNNMSFLSSLTIMMTD